MELLFKLFLSIFKANLAAKFLIMQPILDFFSSIDPVTGAFYATLFTWGVTALGASFVFIFRSMNRAFLDGMHGFTGGVMVAASYWS